MTEPVPLCPDCGMEPGEPHDPNCDVAECNGCGGQRLMCVLDEDCGKHDPSAAIWWGEWPGKKQCRARGWYVVMIPGVLGWQPCSPETTGATEDLNRWSYYRQTGRDGLYERMR